MSWNLVEARALAAANPLADRMAQLLSRSANRAGQSN